jgi:hypothetical protein
MPMSIIRDVQSSVDLKSSGISRSYIVDLAHPVITGIEPTSVIMHSNM